MAAECSIICVQQCNYAFDVYEYYGWWSNWLAAISTPMHTHNLQLLFVATAKLKPAPAAIRPRNGQHWVQYTGEHSLWHWITCCDGGGDASTLRTMCDVR